MSIFEIRDIDTIFIQYLSIHDKIAIHRVNKYYYRLLRHFLQELIDFNINHRYIPIPSWIKHYTMLNKAIISGNLSACQYYIKFTPVQFLTESFELSCEYDFVNITKLLVSKNVDIHRSGDFAFILACNNSNFETVKYLYSLGGFDINMDITYRQSPLDIALRNNDHKLVDWILSIKNV